MAQEGDNVAREENERLESFFEGSDLLIHDTQYTQEEYASKVGWGHTTFEHALAAAKKNNVKRMALYHHDPTRTDAQVEALAEKYCRTDESGDTEVFFAQEGMLIEL
jgi:ribonuclease BN (tRNA processing enzyme)